MTHLAKEALAALPVVLPIPYRDPAEAFRAFADDPIAALLDAPGDGGGFAYLCADPFQTLRGGPDDDPFERLREAVAPFVHAARPGLPPFQGGAVGLLGYELGGALERLPAPKADDIGTSEMLFGLYDVIAAFDRGAKRAWIIASGFPETDPQARLNRARARAAWLEDRLGPTVAAAPEPPPIPWRAELARPDYEARVARVIDYIRAGDIFQANLSQRFLADRPSGLAPFALYERLRRLNPAPFSAYLSLSPDAKLLSASPERFLRVTPDGRVETRPIKGTRPRGATPADDARLAADLLGSEKDRAENLMIVDLLRNDLSKVCALGSVKVPRLCGLESFSAVHHLVSVVEGLLRPGLGAIDLLKAAFPGGSITGAPKIRAMEIIDEMEEARRGPYCGSVAWIGWNGAMDSSIVIRSLTVGATTIVAQAGGGIVADSDPAAEYAETLTKAEALLRTLEGP